MTTMKALALGGALLLPVLTAAGSRAAVTVSVSPTLVKAGQEVTVSAQATFAAAPDEMRVRCPLSISFGDGSPASEETCGTTPCIRTVRHVYRDLGIYQVRAETSSCRAATGAEITTSPLTAEARVSVTPAVLTFTVEPAIIRAPRDRGAVVPLLYRASGAAIIETTLNSPSGSFEVGIATIATVTAPLELRVAGGAGTATETLEITPTILKEAAARGARSLSYSRDFAAAGYYQRVMITVLIINPAVDFDLERLELSFNNHRPEIVVRRGEEGLTAQARLRFTGSGLMQAHWVVDGRILVPPVSRHLNLGDIADLVSPSLPTFDPGTHQVQLVVLSPPPSFPLPALAYLVQPRDAAPGVLDVRLLTPAVGETLPYQPVLFSWEAGSKTAVFLAQFYGADGDVPVFSAWTRVKEYLLPELLYRDFFLAGGRYRWKVSAFDAKENLAGTSPMGEFGFSGK